MKAPPFLPSLPEPAPSLAPARLAIIEDYRSTAEMMRMLCTQLWGFEVIAIEHTCVAALQSVAIPRAEIILLDIGLPDGDGLTLLPQLRGHCPNVKVILLSSLFNDFILGRLGSLSWDGLLDKVSDGLGALHEAIETVRGGGRYVSPAVRNLIGRYRQCNNPHSRMLSDREKEVLAYIAHALTDDEIAERLAIDTSTAHSHRKNLLRKLGQHSTPKLMHHAIKQGYASLPLPA